MKQTEYMLNVPVDILTMSDIMSDMATHFKEKQPMTLTSVNPQIMLMAEKNKQVQEFIETSTHRFADGIGVVKMSRWTKGKISQRVAGIDVMIQALSFANEHHKRVFLYGAAPNVVKLAAENISKQFPDLTLAGYIDGYTKKSNQDIVQMMNDSQADMIFVALGSPRQEEWLYQHMPELNATVYQTIGGSLDVLSGETKRAPELFIKTNLEWVYRSFSNPKRLYRVFQVPLFIAKGLIWHQQQRKQ